MRTLAYNQVQEETMKTIILALALILTGCATQQTGDASSVIVTLGTGDRPADAQKLADAHCQQYGKHAELSGNMSDFRVAYAYRCVK